MSELDDLKKEIANLKQKIDPPPRPPSTYQPYDPTANFSLPPSVVQAMMKAVPDRLMRDLRADAQKPNPVTGGMTKPEMEPPKAIGNKGWIDERPLSPPPGIDLMDRMMDEQDKIDRAELALRLAKAILNKSGADDTGT
jgi:hypothetical protein